MAQPGMSASPALRLRRGVLYLVGRSRRTRHTRYLSLPLERAACGSRRLCETSDRATAPTVVRGGPVRVLASTRPGGAARVLRLLPARPLLGRARVGRGPQHRLCVRRRAGVRRCASVDQRHALRRPERGDWAWTSTDTRGRAAACDVAGSLDRWAPVSRRQTAMMSATVHSMHCPGLGEPRAGE